MFPPRAPFFLLLVDGGWGGSVGLTGSGVCSSGGAGFAGASAPFKSRTRAVVHGIDCAPFPRV